ncbi:hypothetical protein ACC687_42040, partial [Rhizobium ruizarguesonis]
MFLYIPGVSPHGKLHGGDHPVIGQTIQSLKERGKPVVSYITYQSARDRAGFVGTDKVVSLSELKFDPI